MSIAVSSFRSGRAGNFVSDDRAVFSEDRSSGRQTKILPSDSSPPQSTKRSSPHPHPSRHKSGRTNLTYPVRNLHRLHVSKITTTRTTIHVPAINTPRLQTPRDSNNHQYGTGRRRKNEGGMVFTYGAMARRKRRERLHSWPA